MNGIELEFLHLLEGLRSGIFNNIFQYITYFGESTVSFVLIALFYFVLNKEFGKKLVYVLSSATSLNNIFKICVKRTRPFNPSLDNPVTCVYPDSATGYSFPSGHSQNVASYATTIAKEYKKKWMYVVAPVLMLLVGFTRMYLGAHFPTDVIVGLAIGIGCCFLGGYIYDKYGYKKAFLFSILVTIPFVIYFSFTYKEPMATGESIQKDLYAGFGMLVGSYLGLLFEEKKVNFKLNDKIWKRILEMVIALAIAVGFKALLKLPYGNANIALWIKDLLDFVRYTITCFATLGLAPLLFKKINL